MRIQEIEYSSLSKLLMPENFRTLATDIYLAAKSQYNFSNINHRSRYFIWMYGVKNILDSTGFSGMWNTHNLINKKNGLLMQLINKMREIFLSEWYQKVDTDLNYRLFKHKFEFE